MKTHFVISLVLGIMMSNASAHGHGIRVRSRSNDPAKRIYIDRDEIHSIEIPIVPSNEDSHPIIDETPTSEIHLYSRTNSSSSSSSSSSSNSSIPIPLPPSTPPLTLSKPIPKPLDLSISPNLSGGCMIYLTSLLSNTEFITGCLPFSLLLSTSSSYSTLLSTSIKSGDFNKINDLISYTNNPKPSNIQCESLISSTLDSLQSKSNCGTDLNNQNQVAKQTKIGLGNYKLIKDSTNLVNEDTGVFCYIDAVVNKKPDDLYLWNLPSGIPLPSTSTPTCSPCSRSLLNTYMSYTSTTPTLNSTLVKSAVNRVNDACGQGFINLSTIAASSSSSSRSRSDFMIIHPLGLFGMILSILLIMLV